MCVDLCLSLIVYVCVRFVLEYIYLCSLCTLLSSVVVFTNVIQSVVYFPFHSQLKEIESALGKFYPR